ncbi:hypothetical protein TrST_g8529 [Triparma strigata]|uniref:Apple domain-containing protein n=1 Tax=Triparma strigata TaxID=1606541 RepID=A0A9W7BCC5_9STRA|nr:hypothetical protein TrST_g8529 [Triparma strigata]
MRRAVLSPAQSSSSSPTLPTYSSSSHSPSSPTSSYSPKLSTIAICILLLLNVLIWSNRLMTQRHHNANHHVEVHPTGYASVDASINALEERYEDVIQKAEDAISQSRIVRNWGDHSNKAVEHANEALGHHTKAEGIRDELLAQRSALPPPPPSPPSPPASSEPLLPAKLVKPSSWFNGGNTNTKHLAIGMAQGINDAQLCVFVASLRKFSPASESSIVLFMDEVSPKAQEILDKNAATAIVFNKREIKMGDMHPSTYRWPMITDYINDNQRSIDMVLLADVRDMAFQGDPFSIVTRPGLYVFNGVESMTIGQDGWNGGWVKDCFGNGVFQQLYDKKIICSGVSLGTIDSILSYLDLMASTMGTPSFAQCERNGVDQGVHNVLIHTDKLTGSIYKYDQMSGPVANMQAKVMSLTSDFRVVNNANGDVPIMHQYDRYETLMTHLFKLYVDWDIHAESSGEGDCKGYTIKENVEAFKGRCDLSHESGGTVEECCTICNNKGSCKGFTHIRSGCWLKSCGDVNPDQMLSVPGATGGWTG